jgi:hypothetical protein
MTRKELKQKHLKNFSAIYIIEKMILYTKKEQLKLYTQELILAQMENGFVQGIHMKSLVPLSITSQANRSYGIPTREEITELLEKR